MQLWLTLCSKVFAFCQSVTVAYFIFLQTAAPPVVIIADQHSDSSTNYVCRSLSNESRQKPHRSYIARNLNPWSTFAANSTYTSVYFQRVLSEIGLQNMREQDIPIA